MPRRIYPMISVILIALFLPVFLNVCISSAEEVAGVDSLKFNEIVAGDVFSETVEDQSMVTMVQFPELQEGFPIQLQDCDVSPVLTVSDLDHNGFNDIIIDGAHSINIYDFKGNSLPGWPLYFPDANVASAVSAAELDPSYKGKELAVVISESTGCFLHLYHADGTKITDGGWPKLIAGTINKDSIIGNAPILIDVDNDSTLEIIQTSFENEEIEGVVYCRTTIQLWHFDGTLIQGQWPRTIVTHQKAINPSVGNIDEDKEMEIAIGDKDGQLHIFNHDGTYVPGWPKAISNGVLFTTTITKAMITVSSSDGSVHILYGNGSEAEGWPFIPSAHEDLPLEIFHLPGIMPIMVDIDQDRMIDIVMVYDRIIFTINHDGTIREGWPQCLPEDISGNFLNCVVGDIDGDLNQEIIAMSVAPPEIFVFDMDGKLLAGWPVMLNALQSDTSCALAHLDGDGDIEILAVTLSPSELHAFDIPSVGWWQRLDWPMLRHDARHQQAMTMFPFGDVYNDGDIDAFDLLWVIHRLVYGPDWRNPEVDVNQDAKINLMDYNLVFNAILYDVPPADIPDIDVTFIDRVPGYPYDADKNTPEVGDTVTFDAHIKLYDRSFLYTDYVWFMDGIEIGDGATQLNQNQDNMVSIDWKWDNKRHEIMIVFDPENSLIEQSEENNILYDFTDALIVGMAVETGLVDAFPDFQRDLGIGSLSFEDWFQRQIKIWNVVLMEKAGELKSGSLLDIQERVRGVISYHEDGSLTGGNCPRVWKDVDMLWGKLASDIQGYSENNWAWFYEGSLPHELSHARYLPDTYILDLSASCIEIMDDSGYLVTETDHVPAFGWDTVYSNKNQGMMTADYSNRYSLFDAHLLNRIVGERAQGCNTNGCCSHDADWYVADFPESMYLRILRLDGSPWVNARLDIYTRQGTYGNVKVDNIIDYTLYTDSNGRALLPVNVFTNYRQEFVLKISSPEGFLREYRFVERTDFHIAYWAGSKDSFDYTIKTGFDPVPVADSVENVWGHKRGETFDLTFKGSNFKEGGYIRFSNSEVVCNSISYINENDVRVNITIPENNVRSGIGFRLYNPDGKFVRVKDPYEQGIEIVFENTKPYARFEAYDIGNRIPGAYYFNGLWSDDWGRLFKGIDSPLPMEGTGLIASYEWDFGDGSPYGDEPYTIHNYNAPGTYSVTLTVTDTDGETASIAKTVVVTNQTFYRDVDGDTYGNPNVTCLAFTQPEGYVLNNLDCNDKDPNTYTGAIEQCDGKDNDCDGSPGIEEVDVDEDTFMVCGGDCDDADPSTNPEGLEICDGKDNDCDGDVDEGCSIWQMKQRDMYNTGRANFHVPSEKLNDSFFDVFVWQKTSPGNLGSTSMPFYDDAGPEGKDIVVGNYHWPKGIQGMDRQTGQLFWSGNPSGGEVIGEITAAFSNDGKTIYITNDATGIGIGLYPNGHPLMAFKTSSGPSAYWHNGSNLHPEHLEMDSPTVSPDGRIFLNAWADRPYAGTDTGDAIIETWAASTNNLTAHSNPTLYDDANRLIVISGGRWGYIRAYDGETGDELWAVNVGAMVDGSPTIDPENGNIYVGCGNFDIYVAGLDKEGNPLWENPSVLVFDYMEGQNNPQLAQAGGCLSHDGATYYFQTNSSQGDGRLYAINTLDGSLKWSFETHSMGWEMISSSSPIVTENGIIVVGNNDGGTYYAIMDKGIQGTLLDTITVDEAGNARASATVSPDGIMYLPLRTFWIAGNGDGDIPDYHLENLFCAIDLTSEGTMKLYPPPHQTAVTLNHGMSLSWQPIIDPTGQFDHYEVYRATSPFSSIEGMTPIGSVYGIDNTHYTDYSLINGTSYYYAVTTVSKYGGEFAMIASIGPRTPRDETDLQIVCISRTPRFPRYTPIYTNYEITEPSGFGPYIFSAATGLGSGQDENTQRWPDYNDPVTYTAKIRNRGTNTFNSEINVVWQVDGSIVKESAQMLNMEPGDELTFEYVLDWDNQIHEIGFSLDVDDERYENNELVINTKSVPFLTYMDISYIEEFRENTTQYPNAVTDDFIDWLNLHMMRFNQMFADAGCLKRVHYDLLEVLDDYAPDPDIDRQPFAIFPFRFHAGEGSFRLSGYYDQASDIDNGFLHEMGHQLGIIDLYQLDLSDSQNYVSGQGYMGPAGLMHGCSPFISQHTALGMNHWLEEAHGYYGQYMYNIPAEIRLRILDCKGEALEGATVKMYQYCERPGLGKVITDQIKAQGITDSNGEFILPNVPIDHEKVPLTYTGDELQDNPFGYLAVVGTNGVLHFRVEYSPNADFTWVDYAWFDITEANVVYFTGQKDIAIFGRRLALGGPIQYHPPDDMTELNASSWTAWAAGSDSENTYVEDDMNHKMIGAGSLKFITNAGFDTYVRYPRSVSALWDLTNANYLEISFFADNPHYGFQSGSPWIRLKDAENNYFQYQYYKNGYPYDLLNEARNAWLNCKIPLDASSTTENGWRRSTHGSPDMSHIQYMEIHSDTWDYGFTLWLDGVSFDPGSSEWDLDEDGFSMSDGDCNDTDPNINPGASEVCDGIDNDCNGLTDEGCCDLDVDNDCDLDVFDLVLINRCLQEFPVIVPSLWRQTNPHFPPDEEICKKVEECKVHYNIDTIDSLTVIDLVIINRCLQGFPIIVPSAWRNIYPEIPPDSEICQAVEALKPICSP